MWSVSATQGSTNQSSYRHVLLPLAVCAAFELISRHYPHSRMGRGFLAYDHGIARMEKEEKMVVQIDFYWIPLLCFGLSCRLSFPHLALLIKLLTEDIMIPSSPEVQISSLSSSSLLVSHL